MGGGEGQVAGTQLGVTKAGNARMMIMAKPSSVSRLVYVIYLVICLVCNVEICNKTTQIQCGDL